MLVKYDSQHITLEALSRSLFANINDPTGVMESENLTAEARAWALARRSYVYLAPESEMVVLNQAGEIQKRVNVASKLSEFAKTKGYKDFYVDGDEFSLSLRFVAGGSSGRAFRQFFRLAPCS